MPARKIDRSDTAARLRGRAFRYARDLMLNPDAVGNFNVGRAPYSHIDAETIAQRAFTDGYNEARKKAKKDHKTERANVPTMRQL